MPIRLQSSASAKGMADLEAVVVSYRYNGRWCFVMIRPVWGVFIVLSIMILCVFLTASAMISMVA
jgi:hypothetical protein